MEGKILNKIIQEVGNFLRAISGTLKSNRMKNSIIPFLLVLNIVLYGCNRNESSCVESLKNDLPYNYGSVYDYEDALAKGILEEKRIFLFFLDANSSNRISYFKLNDYAEHPFFEDKVIAILMLRSNCDLDKNRQVIMSADSSIKKMGLKNQYLLHEKYKENLIDAIIEINSKGGKVDVVEIEDLLDKIGK